MANIVYKQRFFAFLYLLIFVLSTMANEDRPDTKVVVNDLSSNPFIAEYGEPVLITHRSGKGIAPENTLMAFDACLNSEDFDIKFFEFDVQTTKDGELILLHDSTYDKTSNAVEAFGHKKVSPADYTFEELNEVLNLGENFSIDGEYPYKGLRGDDIPRSLRVMKAEDILVYIESITNGEYQYFIEIKNGGKMGKTAADKLYSILDNLELFDRTVSGSFMPDTAKYMRDNYPEITRFADIFESIKFYYYSRIDKDLSDFEFTYDILLLPYGAKVMPWRKEFINFGTKEVLNFAHKYDIAVYYWTLDKAEDMLYLRENGADAIISDQPVLAYKTLENPKPQLF